MDRCLLVGGTCGVGDEVGVELVVANGCYYYNYG